MSETNGKNGKRIGRPPTPDLEKAVKVSTICDMASRGMLIRDACRQNGISHETFYTWVLFDPAFFDTYARAKECQGNAWAEKALAIAEGDDELTLERMQAATESVADAPEKVKRGLLKALEWAVIQRDRLRVDTLKWAAARRAPKAWGDKQQVEVTGRDGGPVAWRLENLSDGDLKLFEQLAARARVVTS
jgi:hypothetical protein